MKFISLGPFTVVVGTNIKTLWMRWGGGGPKCKFGQYHLLEGDSRLKGDFSSSGVLPHSKFKIRIVQRPSKLWPRFWLLLFMYKVGILWSLVLGTFHDLHCPICPIYIKFNHLVDHFFFYI